MSLKAKKTGRHEARGCETYVVFLKVPQVPDDADPHQQRGGSQEDAAHIVTGQVLREEDDQWRFSPGVQYRSHLPEPAQVCLYLRLYFNLQDGPNDGQEVADDDQHVPAVQELFLVVLTHFSTMILQQQPGEPLKINQSHVILSQSRQIRIYSMNKKGPEGLGREKTRSNAGTRVGRCGAAWSADLEQPDGEYHGASAQRGWREADEDDEEVEHQEQVHVLFRCNTDNACTVTPCTLSGLINANWKLLHSSGRVPILVGTLNIMIRHFSHLFYLDPNSVST